MFHVLKSTQTLLTMYATFYNSSLYYHNDEHVPFHYYIDFTISVGIHIEVSFILIKDYYYYISYVLYLHLLYIFIPSTFYLGYFYIELSYVLLFFKLSLV